MHHPTTTVRDQRAEVVVCAALALALAATACSGATAPPRDSPPLALAEQLPDGRRFPWTISSNAAHTAWVYEVAGEGTLELHDGSGLVASTPAEAARYFDVASDRTAAVCGAVDVRIFDGARWSSASLDALSPAASPYRCGGIALRSAEDVWLVLQPSGDTTPREPDRLCRLGSDGWDCGDLPSPVAPRTLVLTAGHAWWVTQGDVVAVDTSLPLGSITAATIAAGALPTGGWLHPDPGADAVLAVPRGPRQLARVSADAPLERITIDGARESFELTSEAGGLADVWLTRSGRVLALDAVLGVECSGGGPFGYSTGASCGVAWMQTILYELRDGSVIELGHANTRGVSQLVAFGIERADGTWIATSNEGWRRVP